MSLIDAGIAAFDPKALKKAANAHEHAISTMSERINH
jgi:hypothetical protein